MPIRFSCPHCRQKLSVGLRKAATSAECPRCKRTLTIPQPPEPASIDSTALPTTADRPTEASHPPPRSVSPPPTGDAPTFLPDAHEFVGLELVYDTSSSTAVPPAPPPPVDVIVIPRFVVYLQGGLLAAVALVAFAIGMIMGSTFVPQPQAGRQPAVVTGNVTFMSGIRSRPAAEAVIIVLPHSPHRPAVRIPVVGLRPADSPPSDDHRGIAILRQAGGIYARANANGHFELEVPSRGRYWLLVVCQEKRPRSASAVQAADIAKLSPYFDKASELIGESRYQLGQQTIRGDQELTIAID
jgi:hypothetical protein